MTKLRCIFHATCFFLSLSSFAADFRSSPAPLTSARTKAQEKINPKTKILKLKSPPPMGTVFTETSMWCHRKTKKSAETCSCFEPLINDPKKKISFKNELFEIHGLMKKIVKNVSLNCDYVEHGTCGELEYIYCDNRARGFTLRFFSQDLLVAYQTRADQRKYCDGQANDAIVGKVPDCIEMKTKQILHGTGETPRAPAALLSAQKP